MPGAVLAQIAHAALELCVQREDRLALLVERHRFRGRKQPVVDAFEQRKTCLRLHRLQRVADGRLRPPHFGALLAGGWGNGSSSAAATVVRWRMTARRISSWRRFISLPIILWAKTS